ncbi:ribonucleoside hydrolase 1 [Klebsiella pneumoniae]|nr:ribonucleoside hydrolase 1 [Klebsiella pneumoniae]
MALPIMIDCDPGHDDAIALVLALASPELEVKAVTLLQATRPRRRPCATCCVC